MGILKIKELKLFQLSCLDALRDGKDAIVVRPTGSGKLDPLPALLSPGKVTLVIEPVVAIIMNQIQLLQSKEIDAVALGSIASW